MSDEVKMAYFMVLLLAVICYGIYQGGVRADQHSMKIDQCIVNQDKSYEYCAAYVRLNDDR